MHRNFRYLGPEEDDDELKDDVPSILDSRVQRCSLCWRLHGYVREAQVGVVPVYCYCQVSGRWGTLSSANPGLISFPDDGVTWKPTSRFVATKGRYIVGAGGFPGGHDFAPSERPRLEAPEMSVPAGYWLQQSLAADAHTRSKAAVELAQYSESVALPTLIRLTADPNKAVRQVAIAALGRLTRHNITGALRECLTDPDEDLRMAAVDSLSASGGPDALEAVTSALGDASTRVRLRAIESLNSASQGTEALVGTLQDEAQMVRFRAMEALRSSPRPEVTTAFRALLHHQDHRTRVKAAELIRDRALGHRAELQISDQAAVPLLIDNFEGASTSEEGVAFASALAATDPGSLTLIRQWASAMDAAPRSRAALALPYYSDPAALELLIELTRDDEDDTRRTADAGLTASISTCDAAASIVRAAISGTGPVSHAVLEALAALPLDDVVEIYNENVDTTIRAHAAGALLELSLFDGELIIDLPDINDATIVEGVAAVLRRALSQREETNGTQYLLPPSGSPIQLDELLSGQQGDFDWLVSEAASEECRYPDLRTELLNLALLGLFSEVDLEEETLPVLESLGRRVGPPHAFKRIFELRWPDYSYPNTSTVIYELRSESDIYILAESNNEVECLATVLLGVSGRIDDDVLTDVLLRAFHAVLDGAPLQIMNKEPEIWPRARLYRAFHTWLNLTDSWRDTLLRAQAASRGFRPDIYAGPRESASAALSDDGKRELLEAYMAASYSERNP